MRTIQVKITPKLKRLDLFLAHEIKNLSRSQIKKLIGERFIKVNERSADPSYKPVKGDKVTVEIPAPASKEVKAENIPLNVVYEDPDVMVINKDAGMVTHPTLDHPSGTLVNALLYHFKGIGSVGESLRPGIVHRLDKDTSGLIVVAKTEKALESLKKQFKARLVEKKYISLVQGKIEKNFGGIDAPIARHSVNRKKFTVSADGKAAHTYYRLIKHIGDGPVSPGASRGGPARPAGGFSLLEVEPKTGRTHQIRVHLAHIGHPIVGDKLYGGKMLSPRQFLHAAYLEFIHPVTGKRIHFESKLPEDLQKVLEKLQNKTLS